MNRFRLTALTLAVAGALFQQALLAQPTAKHWTGSATVHGQQVPVTLDLSLTPGQSHMKKVCTLLGTSV